MIKLLRLVSYLCPVCQGVLPSRANGGGGALAGPSKPGASTARSLAHRTKEHTRLASFQTEPPLVPHGYLPTA